MNYYFGVLRKYAVFKGRASRKEYWTFFVYNLIIVIVLGFIEGVSGIAKENNESMLAGFYQLAVFIPTIAVGVRRMHDVNKSGWHLIIPFYNVILAFRDGTRGDNGYGADPREVKSN